MEKIKRYLVDRIPNYAVIFVLLLAIAYTLDLGYWKESKNRLIYSDVIHYYAYLPAVFIFDDLQLNSYYEYNKIDKVTFWPIKTPIGKNCIMVSMGMSILYAPGFLATYAILNLCGIESYGFSYHYRIGLILVGLLYLALSLIFLKKVLLRYFSPLATGIALLMMGIGTNLFYYATAETTMSHLYSFFLYSSFLYLTVLWHEKPKYLYSILLGIISGLIVLVRPTNVVIALIFLFWNVSSFETLKMKINLFLRNYKQILVLLLFGLLIWIPQLIYWKEVSGTYFFYSYGDEQKFFFTNPHILETLFSFRKGLFIYTPMMFLAVFGFIYLWRKQRRFFVPLIIFSIVNIYIISSWWSWWYGGSFGLRAYIESYALYSFAFAAFVQSLINIKTLKHKKLKEDQTDTSKDKTSLWVKIPGFAFIGLFIMLNLWQTEQYVCSAIHFVGMTKEAYFQTFFHRKPSGNFYELLTIPDYDLAQKGIYVFNPAE